MEPRTGPEVAIVIPARDEAAVIGDVVRALLSCPALRQIGSAEVIVVDNGSRDGTAEVAAAAGARVVGAPVRGYGRACLAGVRAATAEILVLMDGDGSDVPEDVARVVAPVRRGSADLVVGSRVRGARERGALTPQQRVGNALGTVLLRWVYGVRVSDLGPLRAIRRDVLARLEMREMGYGWSAEMLAKAGRLGLRVREVPADYRRRRGGRSKVAGTLSGTLRASVHILRTLVRSAWWQPTARPRAGQAPSLPAHGRAARRALFILARLPVAGHVKTRLANGIGDEGTLRLYRAFLRDLGARFTMAAARDGYDLYWCYTAPDGGDDADFAACVPVGGALLRQEGADLGARLWHAFQELRARGYQQVIVLGSDSPHIPAAWVADAFAALHTHDVVVGAAHDGGYYLLGQRATLAPVDLFTGIPMSTDTVCARTVARAEAAGLTVARAPATFDVDVAGDVPRLAAVLAAAPSAAADPAPATWAALVHLAARDAALAAIPEADAAPLEAAHEA
ncbi:MAG: TIGR04282 family arsenosugar biosynthesis glycosyltransferase [Ktedonobacterales bacterium]|nr:TIGR04282 family arsenosugar biosynthesis glycosyltransferase [Ktedonobacterales bacterium]